ncbi:MAG: hypothetical protein ABJC79_10625 [Acidimicrobiia bacterium]
MRLARGTAGGLATALVFCVGIVGHAATPAAAAPEPSLDLARPRILGAGTDLGVIRARLDREPYRTIFGRVDFHAHESNGIAPDDHTIGSERIKTKTTKDLAYEYALDRTMVNGAIVPFPSAAARTAAGDAVRDHLLTMYTRSRLAVPPPLGGTDRDINTSEELLQYATAYDTMIGAGYDFGAGDASIRANLTDLAAELYRNYTVPGTANNSALVLPNNHRSKSAAALGVAALALFDTPPPEGTPPTDERAPAAWLAFALDQVDIVQRWTFVAPGGGYGEGPYYERYAGQNLLPFTRAWDHARGNRPWNIGPRTIPDLWRQPVYRATQRWMLDMTLPDGGLAPIDDGNIDFTYYFGLAPVDPADAPAFVWRWAHSPTPYDTDGSVDLSADALANFDDAIAPAEPSGSPTRLDDESGTAVFRSDWSRDAVQVVAVGEHGAAMELGRDRDGLGQVAGAAHEQPDTASYLMHAYGERLLLDPGYLTYEQRGLVGKAPDHNMILVNNKGPADPFLSSIFWVNDRAGLPPDLDGQARSPECPTPRRGTGRRSRARTRGEVPASVRVRRQPIPGDVRRGDRHPRRPTHVGDPRERRWDERRHVHPHRDRRPLGARHGSGRHRARDEWGPARADDPYHQPRRREPRTHHPHRARRDRGRNRAGDPFGRHRVPDAHRRRGTLDRVGAPDRRSRTPPPHRHRG